MLSVFIVSKNEFIKTLTITFGVTFYHFAMRLLIGFLYQCKYNNNISWKAKWFQVGKRETKLYKTIKVNRWKKYIPSYDSSNFDLKRKSYEHIVMGTCQAELVHETIMVFSFSPILFSVWFGAFEVFMITSFISALLDLIFVILQRHNRPRMIRLMKRATIKQNEHN